MDVHYVSHDGPREVLPGLVDLFPSWLSTKETLPLFNVLLKELGFAEEVIATKDGALVTSPKRMTAVYGDTGVAYQYSGTVKVASAWHPKLLEIRQRLEQTIPGAKFNFCLCNLYMDGTKSIGMHSDDEHDLASSTIASVSLGATRTFVLRTPEQGRAP